jgi:hypothetical protein
MSVKLQNAANLATVLVAFMAAGSFCYGCYQFRETQQDTRQLLALQEQVLDQDRDSKAVELMVKYNELMSEPHLHPRPGGSEKEFWRENLGLTIAESIFRLRKNDSGWRETVTWMLSNHVAHLKQSGLNCPTYDAEFVQLANATTQDDLCRPR